MRILAVAALAGALSLGACQSVQNIFSNLPALENMIVTDAELVCQFVPSVETVAAIASTYIAGATPVEQIAAQFADKICASVKAQVPAQSGKLRVTKATAPVISVNGKQIAVTGTFVQ